jgi:predicted transcriptional regulator
MSVDATERLDQIAEELTAIRRLIAYHLIKSGLSQEDLAKALGTSQATVSRMFAKRQADRTEKRRRT